MSKDIVRFSVHATTDNESQAAGITQRLLDQGIDATYCLVSELEERGYSVRSRFEFAVLKPLTPREFQALLTEKRSTL